MTVVVLGVFAALFSALLHAIVVRWLAPRFYVSAIGVCCLAGLLAAVAIVMASDLRLARTDVLLVAILASSLVAIYALVFMGIAWDSPTLALANAIADHGAAGMPVQALNNFIDRHPFVTSRIEAMVRSGTLTDDGQVFVANGNVGLLVRIADGYRRFCSPSDQIG